MLQSVCFLLLLSWQYMETCKPVTVLQLLLFPRDGDKLRVFVVPRDGLWRLVVNGGKRRNCCSKCCNVCPTPTRSNIGGSLYALRNGTRARHAFVVGGRLKMREMKMKMYYFLGCYWLHKMYLLLLHCSLSVSLFFFFFFWSLSLFFFLPPSVSLCSINQLFV